MISQFEIRLGHAVDCCNSGQASQGRWKVDRSQAAHSVHGTELHRRNRAKAHTGLNPHHGFPLFSRAIMVEMSSSMRQEQLFLRLCAH